MKQPNQGAQLFVERALIAWQRGVDRDRPLVDPTSHALRLLETLLTQEVGNTQTSAAVMAVDDDVLIFDGIEFSDTIRDLAHRNEVCPIDMNGVPFVLLAAIEPVYAIGTV